MAHYWLCLILFRIVLPCLITVAAYIRPTVTSYIYLLLGFYLPFFSVPTHRTMVGSTGTYLKLFVIVSILICSYVMSFYFALFFPTGQDYQMKPCSTLERVLRTVGITEFQNLPTLDTITWCLPEPLMLMTSLLLFVTVRKLTRRVELVPPNEELDDNTAIDELHRKKVMAMLLNFGKYLVVFMFCVTAVIRPSVIGVIYYLVFMIVMTYWACNKSLGKVYARILIGLTPIIAAHLSMLFLYQMQYFQDNKDISPESIYGRLFQLVRLRTYKDCVDPRRFKLHKNTIPTRALPYILYLLYYLSVLVSRQILDAKDGLNGAFLAFFKRTRTENFQSKWKMAFSRIKQQIEDEKLDAIDKNSFADRIKNILEHTIQFVIRIAYLVANFTMMIWAISYIGWKSLILLMWANLIWLFPGRRKIMLSTSPFLVIYVWFLLSTSYVYSMNLGIRQTFGVLDLASGSHMGEDLMWIHLLIKSLFSVIIFITMRQFIQERAGKREQMALAEAMDINGGKATTDFGQVASKSKTWEKIRVICRKTFALFWIWVVIITMIFMDFMATSDPFRITFVGLAMVFVITFQIFPFNFWKKFLRAYWWIVIIYAMFNLFAWYFYQLPLTRKLLQDYLYSDEVFRKLGFRYEANPKKRFFILAYPLFLQIAIVIQKNYLQKDFDRFTAPTTPETLAKEREDLEEIHPFLKKFITVGIAVKNFFFVVMEIHLHKFILLVGWLLCCYDCCAMFLPFVLLLTVSCIAGRLFTWIAVHLMSFFVEVLILVRLIYMNQYTKHNSWDYIGYYERNGQTYNVTLNTADWLGFHKSSDPTQADFSLVAWCFFFVFTVTLEPLVRLRQLNYRKARDMSTASQRVMFPEVNYGNCHDNTKNMIKFLINYGFYKFGIEITAVVAVIVMAIRMDMFAIVMAISLLMTFSLSRKWIERTLMPFMLLAGIWLPLQYFMSLGLRPMDWARSKTTFWNENDFKVRVQQFCHIMNMAHPPPKEKIIYDFILLMCFSRQWRMVRVTRSLRGQEFGAGNNENVGRLIDADGIENPVPDFVTYSRNFLDVYKKLFFFSWFYLSLLVTFLAGTLRPTIFSFGYIFASFFIMWEGSEMFLRPSKSILFRWNLLILYNLLVLAFRTVGQIFGCILVYEWQNINCKVYSLFNVVCFDNFDMTSNIPNMDNNLPCTVEFDLIGLKWDCACFFFLIMQQRVFKTFHFFHIVNDSKAQTILANRGAQLIEDQRRKHRQAYDNQHDYISKNMEKKAQRYRENRQKIQGDVYLRRKKNHKHMLRSGDYYLFDDVDRNLDIPILPLKQEYVDTEFDPYDPMPVSEYIHTFLTSNLKGVLEERTLRKRQRQAVMKGETPENLKKAVVLREARPGSSSDPDAMSEAEPGPSTVEKILNILVFLWGLVESLVVSVTAFFNRLTRDFRFILHEMDQDRMFLKETTNYTEGVRIGSNKIWNPLESNKNFFKTAKRPTTKGSTIYLSIYAKLLKSIWLLGVSQSEWLCYLVIILNQATRANFISLPLPLMVFCWGSLMVPKPSKTFWVITISYALIMTLIKKFFVMDLADWNEHKFPDNLFYPPTVIGIGRYIDSFINLALLCSLFFHRVVLQWLGLWEPLVYRTSSLIKSGHYSFNDGKLTPLNEAGKYAEGFRLFIQQIISPSSTQIPVDVYTLMFLCDLMNLLLIVFFFSNFESVEDADHVEGGFIQYMEDNRVPAMYLGVFVVMCIMIFIDRWIYMRKNRFAKLVYHFFQVMFTHIWAFVLFPMITGRLFEETVEVQLFYVFKCLYFLFSAYQIRNGYPHLISSHFLTHGTSLFNRYGVKVFRSIPYLFEMRSLLDWTCTDTSLNVSDWFKMEEIEYCIFDQKCQQDFEALMSESGGQRRNRTLKYFIGGFFLIFLYLLIIFPFLVFSLGASVGVRTHPAKIIFEVYMGSAEPIFQSFASHESMIKITEEDYKNLTRTFNNIHASETLFGAFVTEDVVVVKWSSHSLTSWTISPGSLKEMIKEVESNSSLHVKALIHYTHVGSGGEKSDKVFGQSSEIPPGKGRRDLLDMLQNHKSDQVIWLPLVFPKFMMITKEAKPKALPIMEEPQGVEEHYATLSRKRSLSTGAVIDDDDDDDEEPNHKRLRNLLLTLQRKNGQMWWQIKEECNLNDDNYMYYLKDLVHNSCDHLVMYTFNEKVFSSTINYLTSGGIVGLYFIYFMVTIGVIRSCIISVSEIWIEDLPNSDRIMRKCQEVYVARDMQNFELEEELFSELIFIMRSREICIKMTRYADDPYNPNIVTPGTRRQRVRLVIPERRIHPVAYEIDAATLTVDWEST